MDTKFILQSLQEGEIDHERAMKEILDITGLGDEDVHVVTNWPRFPELFRLNRIVKGRHIFWLHGGVGNVQPYLKLALTVQRPFWGIQSKGWMSPGTSFLRGIPEMAAYYVEIIRTVQPEGPYELGGYSMGGSLAYEITKQLQESGETVNTIVMIDTPASFDHIWCQGDYKDMLLKTVNTLLLPGAVGKQGKLEELLVHSNELDTRSDEESFLQQLTDLALKKGLKRKESLFKELVCQRAQVIMAYDIHRYVLSPLPYPENVSCYYFHNKNGLFYGDMEPYFCLATRSDKHENNIHRNKWKELIPDFHLINLIAPNHIQLLYDQQSVDTISTFCNLLYSEQGLTMDAFRAFKTKVNIHHGGK
ncbi:MAG TPA: thioesterase domain-containing protein [Chitinophaga sp.]|uniref:thioesterase domain-containing protein n=1 Tax=Chitinophaga sp. TaxID=1869181 RepID=UPI002CDEE504|nr:thioesterase domain-containing protein [Chitinophaga sp.]HVI46505.1 thioesterase domain-containing protein [Chitinophaga sp.]